MSVSGVHERPSFVVFQTTPLTLPIKRTLALLGSARTASIAPVEVPAGVFSVIGAGPCETQFWAWTDGGHASPSNDALASNARRKLLFNGRFGFLWVETVPGDAAFPLP